MTDEQLERAVAMAALEPAHRERLLYVLKGRRDKVLARYLAKLSPLAWPQLLAAGPSAHLCLEDMAVLSQVAPAEHRSYATRAWAGDDLRPVPMGRGHLERSHWVCQHLPKAPGASPDNPQYVVVDVTASTRGKAATLPARVHLYHLGGRDYRIVGLERPYSANPPSG
jgi:hypothetical protein